MLNFRRHQSISFLDSSCPTYVLLSAELVPAHAKHIHQPVAPLGRSLYGHPLASASWQNHLATILSKELGGVEMPEQPSCFHFPSTSLALSVYVDDLTLSGPQKIHSKFWSTLQKHVQLEDPAELSNVLGRNHVSCDQGLALHFAKQCVELYNCPARRSSISAPLTVMAEPWLILMINVLDSSQHHLQSL